MRDLTQGSIRGHLVKMATPIMISMLVQTLYFAVDLYFVSGAGSQAVAGVGAAGNVVLFITALTQMLGVATVSLIAHAAGARDRARANLVFGQSMLLGAACALVTVVIGACVAPWYMHGVAADAGIAHAGVTYILWDLPGLALQFVMAVAGSVLRGTGLAKPGMIVQIATVGLNIVLAPVLIAGWGTHVPMGVAGAGLATSLSVAFGTVLLLRYFARLEHFVALSGRLPKPDWALLGLMLKIGLPAGAELLLLVVVNSTVFTVIRGFGAEAQAGFGIGGRVIQSLIMPSMAIAFAMPAVAGQNFGGRQPHRVVETFRQALLLELVVMTTLVLVCQLWPEVPVGWFTQNPHVAQVGIGFLKVTSWNFFASGVVFACSGMLQGLGNTMPSLGSSMLRLVVFVLSVLWVSQRPGFQLVDVWHLSVASVIVQALASLVMVRWQMRARLAPLMGEASTASAGAVAA